MTNAASHRGAAAIGQLADLPPIEALSVCLLRSWCDGHRDRINRDFANALGPDAARRAAATLAEICTLCARQGRRPLMRHGMTCSCLGADEACFATLIAAGADGQREDAMMLAALIVRVEMAPLLANLAIDFGMSLRRFCLRTRNDSQTSHASAAATLH